MRTLLTSLVIFASIAFSQQERVRYDNYQVHRVVPTKAEQLKILKQLQEDSSLDFWTSATAVKHYVDVMIPPYKLNEFLQVIRRNNLESEILISNVQNLIDNERSKRKTDDFGWDDYHTLEEINIWLSNLAETYPDQVTLQKGGTTYEGRPIVGVRVSFTPGNENKSVFIEANIHAREWISSAVATYILNQLLTSTDTNVREVAESHDWYVFPVINPDGFAYTHSTNRAWRKTRVPHGDTCYGADPNRNWANHFNEGGASDDPCSDMYAGPEAFSEPSTKSLSEYLLTIGHSLEGYISFHSYHQAMLLPYGYTSDHLDNYDELYEVGLKAIDALSQRYGTQYEIGDVAEIMYVAAGGSPDWVKGTFGTRITYTYELRDTGEYGFLLPAELIVPTSEETLDSIITIFQEFAKKS